jgi:hypothetical protein
MKIKMLQMPPEPKKKRIAKGGENHDGDKWKKRATHDKLVMVVVHHFLQLPVRAHGLGEALFVERGRGSLGRGWGR